MRLAIDAESLITVFGGDNGNMEDAVRSSILAVTELILDDYDEKVFNDGSGMSHQWLKRIYESPDRLRTVSDDELIPYGFTLNDLESSYIGAAYINGQLLIRDTAESATLKLAKKYGVTVINSSTEFNFKHLDGNHVIKSYVLNSTTKHRHNIIRKYFNQETEITIYDRYLKDSSIVLLEQVLGNIAPDATVTIISEFERHCIFTANDVKARLLKVAPNRKINCYYPNFREQSDTHDRHIHLGRRFQLTFTSGLDCFGNHPKWINSECDIQVYYLGLECSSREYAVTDRIIGGSNFKVAAYSKSS